jgi:cytochrome c oxidase assembly protein subunit 11
MAISKNARLGIILMGLAVGMLGMAYAAVPLYKIFCQVTGYGGTTKVADATNGVVLDRTVKVRFTANTHKDMPWAFRPQQASQTLKVGEQGLAFFEAVNLTDKVIIGTATFNVTPYKVATYFNKIQCFCFTEQTLQPGERVDMPVTYFIDPEIADDENLDDVKELVLSYTFFMKSIETDTQTVAMITRNKK